MSEELCISTYECDCPDCEAHWDQVADEAGT